MFTIPTPQVDVNEIARLDHTAEALPNLANGADQTVNGHTPAPQAPITDAAALTGAPQNAKLDAALARVFEGWSVHPLFGIVERNGGLQCECQKGADCTTPGKHPRLTGWQEKATQDLAQVAAWWHQWPYANMR